VHLFHQAQERDDSPEHEQYFYKFSYHNLSHLNHTLSFGIQKTRYPNVFLLRATKVTARSPATANVASKPGVELVVVVDLVVLVGSVEGVELVVVVVDLDPSGPGSELVVVVDLVTSGLGVVLVVVVDFVTSSAAPRANSIIVAMSMATNIFFISNLHLM